MNTDIKQYIEKYPSEIIAMFFELRELLYASTDNELEETMWAKLPSYYLGKNFVRLIPFKDHINIEAQSILRYKDKLTGYKITPKGMLQIYYNQSIDRDILMHTFKETLEG